MLSDEAVAVVRSLNPWWVDGTVRPVPPAYVRPGIAELGRRLSRRAKGLIEVLVGPRQVGKTTGMQQIVAQLLAAGLPATDVLFIRFDLELLREERGALRAVLDWYATNVRERPLRSGGPTYLFLDEVHKLRRWNDEVKHIGDTFPLRILVTGSSAVLLARGGRESLAGRTFTTQLPTFSFREVLEAWPASVADVLPPRVAFADVADGALVPAAGVFAAWRPQRKLSARRALERYYARGGYPRLYSGEVDDDRWADYLVQTVFENVLGADIPDLFPVESPGLLRAVYLAVARATGNEIAQNKLAENLTLQGIPANQPTVGKYLHYLADALLIREFRRYPLAKKASARVPAKITLTDLGVRNALFRGAPSLWESDPGVLGPLVETMVQDSLRGPGLTVHFYRDYEQPGNRRSPIREVDFVVEFLDGTVVPVEVKFRKRIDAADLAGLDAFRRRFDPPLSVVVTRDQHRWDPAERVLQLPLHAFLLSF
jgi:predicted AAA+ superfamily ATPase